MRPSLFAFRITVALLASFEFLFTASPTPAALAWRLLSASPVNLFRHDDVFFINPQIGWVVNTDGFIYKTTDGGASWATLVNHPESIFRCVGFVNEQKGWVGNIANEPGCFTGGTDTNLLYSTTDGGTTWTPVTNIPDPQPKGLCGICVVNENVVYATGRVCDTPRVIKSTDGGATWQTIDMTAHADRLIDCYFIDEETGFLAGGRADGNGISQGVLLFTSDGGASWVTRHQTADATDRWCWKITAPSPTTLYASLQIINQASPYVLKSTDAGVTWTSKALQSALYFEQGIGFATESTGWIGGSADTYETTNGGDNWVLRDFMTPNENVNRFRFFTPTFGYAVGRRVWKYSDDAAVAAPTLPIEEPHEEAWLEPARPNPAQGSTEFVYRLPVSGKARIAMYNVLGREVALLVDQFHEPGTYSTRLDVSNLPSGAYIVRLQTPTRNETQKVQLIR